MRLSRIIGFSTHAHDHVHWQPASGQLVYASGDTLVVERLFTSGPPAYLMGGSGEISTLALSPDGRFAVAMTAAGGIIGGKIPKTGVHGLSAFIGRKITKTGVHGLRSPEA